MTTDDAVRAMSDAWGRPVVNGVPVPGPAHDDEESWPTTAMLVLSDADLVTCAARFARAFSSAHGLTIWLLCLDEYGWTTRDVAQLVDLPSRPPEGEWSSLMAEITRELAQMAPDSRVLAAIASPDGGDRGARELTWTHAILDGAAASGLPVRGVVAVGAHRARLLYTSVPS